MNSRPIIKSRGSLARLLVTLILLIAFTGVSQAAKYKVGVSVPSADHGWTAGLLWWAKKAVSDINAKEKDVEFFVVAAS